MLFGLRAATRLNGPSVYDGALLTQRYVRAVEGEKERERVEREREERRLETRARRNRRRDRDVRGTRERQERTSEKGNRTRQKHKKEKERARASEKKRMSEKERETFTHTLVQNAHCVRGIVHKAQRVEQTEVRSSKAVHREIVFFNISRFPLFRPY